MSAAILLGLIGWLALAVGVAWPSGERILVFFPAGMTAAERLGAIHRAGGNGLRRAAFGAELAVAAAPAAPGFVRRVRAEGALLVIDARGARDVARPRRGGDAKRPGGVELGSHNNLVVLPYADERCLSLTSHKVFKECTCSTTMRQTL